jgi:hypothetical protein
VFPLPLLTVVISSLQLAAAARERQQEAAAAAAVAAAEIVDFNRRYEVILAQPKDFRFILLSLWFHFGFTYVHF